MTDPVEITIESVERIGPFVVYTSGNLAYVGIRPDLFLKAWLLGTIDWVLQDAFRAAAAYESYERVLFITPEQALVANGVRLPFEQAGFQDCCMLVREKSSVT